MEDCLANDDNVNGNTTEDDDRDGKRKHWGIITGSAPIDLVSPSIAALYFGVQTRKSCPSSSSFPFILDLFDIAPPIPHLPLLNSALFVLGPPPSPTLVPSLHGAHILWV